jgi:hypothetical protein
VVKKISPSVITYLLILVVIVVLRLLLSLFPSGQIASQMVNLTDTFSIGAIWLIGWVGVFLAARAGFAEMWQEDISNAKRWLIPFLIGLVFGLFSIIFDKIQPLGEASLIKFPASLVAYPLAGILEEIIFRLFLTTTFVWVISNMLLRGRRQVEVFWGVAVFLGVFYTLSQLSLYKSLMGTLDLFIAAQFFVMIGANFIVTAYFYRKYGFLAAISLRMGDYLLWHIVWGAIAKG